VRGGKAVVSGEAIRATGITTFLENGGQLEVAHGIGGHANSRATRMDLSGIVRVRS